MDNLPYFFDLLKNNFLIREAVTSRVISADQLHGINYRIQKKTNAINLSNFILNEQVKFKTTNILISHFGTLVEFVSKDLKYFEQTEFYFNACVTARKHKPYYKKGKEFTAKCKRLTPLKLFDKTVHATLLQSDLYGCKIMISFF